MAPACINIIKHTRSIIAVHSAARKTCAERCGPKKKKESSARAPNTSNKEKSNALALHALISHHTHSRKTTELCKKNHFLHTYFTRMREDAQGLSSMIGELRATFASEQCVSRMQHSRSQRMRRPIAHTFAK